VILQPDVSRDFVAWVEGQLKGKGLKTEVMYLHPRIPKDQVIQRQAAEGVHAVVELDLRAQHLGKVPVQAFDRAGGSSNVRFDQYVDLDPSTAAEVVLRAKASGASSYNQGYGVPGGYPAPYGGQPLPPQQQMPQYPPAHQFQHQPQPSYPGQHQAPPAPQGGVDLSSLVGKLDNHTLQQLLASINGPGAVAAATPPGGHRPHGSRGPPQAANPQVDIQALLGSLGGGGVAPQPGIPQPPQGQYGAPYGAPMGPNGPPAGPGPGPGANGDSAAQVQNIMAQLARFR
jgi:nuclear polyadenylated RNA-binding protein 3